MKTLGYRLKELRKEKDISQENLADELNRSFSTKINKGMVSKWENDREEPRMEYVRNIAQFFNVSLDFLLCLSDERQVVEKMSENDIITLAAHHDGEEWTEEELEEIENFKKYVLSKRKNK